MSSADQPARRMQGLPQHAMVFVEEAVTRHHPGLTDKITRYFSWRIRGSTSNSLPTADPRGAAKQMPKMISRLIEKLADPANARGAHLSHAMRACGDHRRRRDARCRGIRGIAGAPRVAAGARADHRALAKRRRRRCKKRHQFRGAKKCARRLRAAFRSDQ